MGLLDADAIERMGPALDQALGGAPPEPPAPPTPAPQIETAPEPSSPAQDVNLSANEEPPATVPEPSVEVPSGDESGHNVPYGRFKQVLEARNSHRDEVAALRSQLKDLEAQQASYLQQQIVQSKQQAPVQSQDEYGWLDELAGETADAVAPQPDPRVHTLAQQVEAQGVALHKMQLEREMGAALEKFPGVDRRQVLQGVVQNPQASVMEIAEQVSTYVASVEERAIARYLKDNPQLADALKAEATAAQDASTPSAPPRPLKGSGKVPSIWANDERPQSVEEGSALLREFLTKHNPFA